MLSKEELRRYARNINIEEIGVEGQLKLKNSIVTIIGCGALGSVAAIYLAAAGIGKLRLVEFDTVDISNLQRQVFYEESSTGKSKVQALAERISKLNSGVEVEIHETLLSSGNADSFLNDCDFVIDATDNPESKRLIDSTCSTHNIPRCIAGVNGFHGQITTCIGNKSSFSDLFPEAASEGVMPCSVSGVIGPAAGTAACIQASEAIKHITQSGNLLINKLLVFNLLTPSFKIYNLE